MVNAVVFLTGISPIRSTRTVSAGGTRCKLPTSDQPVAAASVPKRNGEDVVGFRGQKPAAKSRLPAGR